MQIHGAVLTTSDAASPFGTSRPIEIRQLELDEPEATEVLVRIEAAGICHSDLSVVDGNRPRPLPMLLGHEAAGIVEAVGSDVHDVRVGERVVATFLPRCGQCRACSTEGRLPCERGSASNANGDMLAGGRRLHDRATTVAHHLGVSAFASHAILDRRSIVPVASDVPADIAALLGCAVLTGGGAVINAGRPVAGQTLGIVGLGGVGMAALLVALADEGVEVVGVDVSADKRRLASRLGAAAVMTPDEAESDLRADVVIEAAGSARAFATAVRATAPGGRTVTVGLPPASARAEIAPLSLVAEAREIVGSYLGSAVPSRDIPRYERLWRDGRLPLEHLVTKRISLTSINEGMDALAHGEAVRQIVEFPWAP